MSAELFLIPFLTGLACAIVLPVLGCYLRLRDEWLAALAYAHVAAAGALLALIGGVMPALGGMAAAALAGGGKRLFAGRLAGGAAFAHSLFDGQLYFSGVAQLALVAPWSLFAAVALVLLSRHLLLARVYPDYFTARRLRAWPVVLGFDLLAALTLALATMTMGVMGGFALVFVPAWIAFRRARSWRKGMLLAVVIGVAGYGAAFLLPVLALLLIAVGLIIA